MSVLTVDTVVDALLEHAIICPADVVERGVEVREVARRNLNLQVGIVGTPGGYFVKQRNPADPGTAITHHRELAFYCWCRDAQVESVPRMVGAIDDALVLELVPDAATVRDCITDRAGPGLLDLHSLGMAIGAALRTVHAALSASPEAATLLDAWPLRTPWVFQLHQPTPTMLADLSPANIQLIRLLQQHDTAARRLHELNTGWVADGAIHMDVKADNLLVTRAGDRPTITIVDWELVQRGDRAWDVASVFHDALLFWVFSMPMGPAELDDLVAQATLPLSGLAEMARGCCTAYVERGEAGLPAERVMQYAGARLLQSVFEHGHDADAMPNHALALTQLALNLLDAPCEAASTLFGLEP